MGVYFPSLTFWWRQCGGVLKKLLGVLGTVFLSSGEWIESGGHGRSRIVGGGKIAGEIFLHT